MDSCCCGERPAQPREDIGSSAGFPGFADMAAREGLPHGGWSVPVSAGLATGHSPHMGGTEAARGEWSDPWD